VAFQPTGTKTVEVTTDGAGTLFSRSVPPLENPYSSVNTFGLVAILAALFLLFGFLAYRRVAGQSNVTDNKELDGESSGLSLGSKVSLAALDFAESVAPSFPFSREIGTQTEDFDTPAEAVVDMAPMGPVMMVDVGVQTLDLVVVSESVIEESNVDEASPLGDQESLVSLVSEGISSQPENTASVTVTPSPDLPTDATTEASALEKDDRLIESDVSPIFSAPPSTLVDANKNPSVVTLLDPVVSQVDPEDSSSDHEAPRDALCQETTGSSICRYAPMGVSGNPVVGTGKSRNARKRKGMAGGSEMERLVLVASLVATFEVQAVEFVAGEVSTVSLRSIPLTDTAIRDSTLP